MVMPNTVELPEVRISVRGLTEFTDNLTVMITIVDHSALYGRVQADTREETAVTIYRNNPY